MNETPYNRASDDLKLIKDILLKSQPTYKVAIPVFRHFAVLWWSYTLVSMLLSILGTYLAYTADEIKYGIYNRFSSLPELVLSIAVACLCLIWRRKLNFKTMGSSTQKLLGIWFISSLIFVFSNLALVLLKYLGSRALYLFDSAPPSLTTFIRLGLTVTVLTRTLFVIFPSIPLILTAWLIREKDLLAVGILTFIASLFWILLLSFSSSITDSIAGTPIVWNLILCMLTKLSSAAAFLILNIKLRKVAE